MKEGRLSNRPPSAWGLSADKVQFTSGGEAEVNPKGSIKVSSESLKYESPNSS